jgi:hypothetical protein
MVDMK